MFGKECDLRSEHDAKRDAGQPPRKSGMPELLNEEIPSEKREREQAAEVEPVRDLPSDESDFAVPAQHAMCGRNDDERVECESAHPKPENNEREESAECVHRIA